LRFRWLLAKRDVAFREFGRRVFGHHKPTKHYEKPREDGDNDAIFDSANRGGVTVTALFRVKFGEFANWPRGEATQNGKPPRFG
jgi:hypothetical protein